MKLFRIVSPRDEIVIGIDDRVLPGADAGLVARWLRDQGAVTVWQYAVGRGPDGQLAQSPLQRIGLLAHDALRVEPLSTPYRILPPPAD